MAVIHYQVELYDLSVIKSIRDRLADGRWDAAQAKIMSEALTQLLERAVVVPDEKVVYGRLSGRTRARRGERASLDKAEALGFAAGEESLSTRGRARYDESLRQLEVARGDRWNRAYAEGYRRAGSSARTSRSPRA